MTDEIIKTIKNLLIAGKGDSKRLREIMDTMKNGEPIVMSDYRYIQTLTESVKDTDGGNPTIFKPSKRDNSLELLRIRLAEGQITIEEFRRLKQALTEDEP